MPTDTQEKDHGEDPSNLIQEHLMREERFLEGLTEEEQEEACEWLEKLVSERKAGKKEDED
ncbi:MAG: hypothetical protein P8165_10925 [Deltaproteobacteria bacterium]